MTNTKNKGLDGAYNVPLPPDARNYGTFDVLGSLGQNKYAGIFTEEYDIKLRGRRGVEVYKEMAESDSVIGSMLFAVEMLLRQAKWYVEPAGNTEADKKAAEFVEGCMHDMEDNWQDTISEIMSFLIYGWSYHEICYKRRAGKSKNKNLNSKYDDGLIGWRKLPIRPQDTLWQWNYDENDDLVGMTQMAPPNFNLLTVPVDKALHFKTKSVKANPEGRSILRNCYRDWYFKRRMQEIEGVGVERDLAGLPVITPPEGVDIWNAAEPEMVAQLAMAQQLVQNVRRDALEGVVKPFGWEFELLNGGSRRQFEIGTIIERYDSRISMTILADFVLLGHQNTGSWALSSDKTEMFSMAIGTYMDIICNVFNTQGIPRLIDLNAEHFKGITDYPKMAHGDIEKPDVSKFADMISKLVSSGVIMPTEELSKEVCRTVGLPDSVAEESIELIEENRQMGQMQNGAQALQAGSDGEENNEQGISPDKQEKPVKKRLFSFFEGGDW